MKLFDLTNIPLLSRAMDAYSLRHKAIASNIANIGTSGYRARSVQFEEELAAASRANRGGLAATDERHFGGASSSGVPEPVMTDIPTGNGAAADPHASGMNEVDLDYEMAELAKNQLRYKFSARLIADTFKGIQKSIRGSL
jgi:flagellar basal-body rod protein FlgB